MNIDHNPYIDLANKELYWLPMDTEKLYKENLNNKKELLEKYNWIDSNFTYKFNSHGFRCNEFTNDPSIVFLGCSITAGIGIPLEATWASLVSAELNLACYNLGIGGSSNDTAFRLANSWLERIKPKVVVFCQTYDHRIEIFDSEGSIANISSELPEFYNTWLSNKYNATLLKVKNRLAIAQLCNLLNIKFLYVNVEDIHYQDLARDLAHPGIQTNIDFSKSVLKKL